MKKVIRIIIPLVLALAIIICTGWYFLTYDRGFTKDILLSAARYFESKGNLSASTWFYNHAYKQTGDNDAVAIELAEQYRQSGNYTKAEFTLTQAIAEGGGVELYIALSKVFVEQDKILDAIKMLDTVTNKDIKAQLDAMRPATPTCSPDPDKDGNRYSQYITVTISAQSGTLYVNTSTPYPSIKKDLYNTNGITLKNGSNTIYAVAIAENGLVSRQATFNFTVTDVVKEITFADMTMEIAVRDMLDIESGVPIYTNDLWTIEEFVVPGTAENLADLQNLVNLKKLTIVSNPAIDLQYITTMDKLEELYISNVSVPAKDLAIIGKLPSLKRLTLQKCSLSTVSGLDLAKGLTYLNLSDNAIRVLNPLSELQNLEELNLTQNALIDLQALSTLKNLKALHIGSNALTSLNAISVLTDLQQLDVSNNLLTDLGVITNFTKLVMLDISKNQISDISVLANITDLVTLKLASNNVTDISALGGLNKLKTLDFSDNAVAELPKWEISCALTHLNAAKNRLTSIERLAGLANLNYLNIDHNEDITTIIQLITCPRLVKVDAFGTKATDVKDLDDLGIWVNYDPTANQS